MTQDKVKIEYHILQSFPVTCLNRDDVGAPKTAVIGGTTRARVSSQCWKRQVRLSLRDLNIQLGIRTRKLEDLLVKAFIEEGADSDDAIKCAKEVARVLTKGKEKKGKSKKDEGEEETTSSAQQSDGVLFFFSKQEAKAFASYAREKQFEVTHFKSKGVDKELAKIAKKAFNPAGSGLDIALFGRMVANAPDMNIEAAAAFSHAISTHKISNEVEFFTALDDQADEPGSAHMGSLEYNSATYYRYVSLDLAELRKFYGEDDKAALQKAVDAFTRALYLAIPSARQTTQSGACPWEFARVMVRTGQRLQIPFETAVKAKDGGFLLPSTEALKDYLDKKEKLSGSLFGKVASYDWGEDETFSIDDLSEKLQSHVQ